MPMASASRHAAARHQRQIQQLGNHQHHDGNFDWRPMSARIKPGASTLMATRLINPAPYPISAVVVSLNVPVSERPIVIQHCYQGREKVSKATAQGTDKSMTRRNPQSSIAEY